MHDYIVLVGVKMSKDVKKLIVSALRAIERDEDRNIYTAKSRVGKKAISGHFEPEVGWQLKKLALDQQTTVQKLLEEALGDLFHKYHLPKI